MTRATRLLPVLVALTALVVGGVVTVERLRTRPVSDPITRPAPDLGPGAQRLLPGLRGARVVVPDRPHDPAEARSPDRFERIRRTRTFTVDTNSLGLRGPEPASPKRGFRILAVGDSVTFGWGVSGEEAWPALLARELGVEVLNAGVPARRPDAMARWLEQEGRALDPDLVLFVRRPDRTVPGDAIAAYAEAVRRAAAAVAPAPLGVVLPPVSTFDPEGSARWREEHAAVERAVAPVPVLELTPVFREALPRPGIVLEVAGGRQRVRRLPGGEVLLDAPAPERGLAPEVIALFEERPELSEPLFFDGGHPDEEGLRLFSAEVARWVRERGWLPATPRAARGPPG